MSDRPRFLVIDEDINEVGLEALRAAGDVTIVPATISEIELLPRLPGVVGILVRKGRITPALIDAAPDLRIIARHGVGVDSVDLEAVARRGIVLTTTMTANSNAVAEYTTALLLGLVRHTARSTSDMKAGRWAPTEYSGAELSGKTLGIVGFGQIGRIVSTHARAFGMRVLVVDPLVPADVIAEYSCEKFEYTDLLPKADLITFHVRLTDQTRGMFGEAELAKVKPGVRIINTARGGICDEQALARGLESGVIAGVALDTFACEPIQPENPLLDQPNAMLSPHIGGQTAEAMRNMSLSAARSLIDYVQGRTPQGIYPLPQEL